MRRDFSKIKTHSFQGKRYDIIWRKPSPDDGHCDPPDSVNKRMNIAPSLSEFDLLETAIHEGSHAAYFIIDEPTIEQGSNDIARLLWRMGWRLK